MEDNIMMALVNVWFVELVELEEGDMTNMLACLVIKTVSTWGSVFLEGEKI